MTVKLNTHGAQQWTATCNGTANFLDYATAVAVDDAGNVYVTGNSCGQSEIVNRNGGLIGYNGTGNTGDFPTSIALDAAANVYVTGRSGSTALTISYSSAGVLN